MAVGGCVLGSRHLSGTVTYSAKALPPWYMTSPNTSSPVGTTQQARSDRLHRPTTSEPRIGPVGPAQPLHPGVEGFADEALPVRPVHRRRLHLDEKARSPGTGVSTSRNSRPGCVRGCKIPPSCMPFVLFDKAFGFPDFRQVITRPAHERDFSVEESCSSEGAALARRPASLAEVSDAGRASPPSSSRTVSVILYVPLRVYSWLATTVPDPFCSTTTPDDSVPSPHWTRAVWVSRRPRSAKVALISTSRCEFLVTTIGLADGRALVTVTVVSSLPVSPAASVTARLRVALRRPAR